MPERVLERGGGIDGSVLVAHDGVDLGQRLHTKIIRVRLKAAL